MENDYKREARRQYLKYFRFWFIAALILIVTSVGVLISRAQDAKRTRENMAAPSERVYDYADILTETEEDNLRKYIAKAEAKYRVDIVLVTTSQPMEGSEAMEKYGYRSTDWFQNMRDTADDFWDENKYGFNKGLEGDGALLLSNWYEGQGGEYLATSGEVEFAFSEYDIDELLDRVGRYVESDPYRAYVEYVDALCETVEMARGNSSISVGAALLVSTIVGLIYLFANLNQKKAKDTTTATTYVAGGKPVIKEQSDQFLRQHVTRRVIEANTGTRSGGGGGGGHHRSSSGASHGGGGRRR